VLGRLNARKVQNFVHDACESTPKIKFNNKRGESVEQIELAVAEISKNIDGTSAATDEKTITFDKSRPNIFLY